MHHRSSVIREREHTASGWRSRLAPRSLPARAVRRSDSFGRSRPGGSRPRRSADPRSLAHHLRKRMTTAAKPRTTALVRGRNAARPRFLESPWDRDAWSLASTVESSSGRCPRQTVILCGEVCSAPSRCSASADRMVRAEVRRIDDVVGCTGDELSRQSRCPRGPAVSFRSCCRRRRNDRSDSLVLHSIARSNAAAASSRRSTRANTSARAVWKYT